MSELDEKLRQMVQSAYANAPAVKARFDEAGINPHDIQTVADLVQIPIMPKDQIIQLQQSDPPFGGMLGVSPDQVTHIFFSPGPIYEPALEPDDSSLDMAVECLRRSGFQPGQRVLNSFSYHLVPAGLTLDMALTRLGCIVVPGGVGNSDLQLKMVEDLHLVGYVGTPSFLLHLLEKADEIGKQLTLTHALVSAEPLLPPMRAAIAAHGVAIGNAYATADFGMLALNLGQGLAMQLLPQPIVEVLDPDTGQPVGPGEPGEVVATNFSKIYPLIRIGTGDMAVNVDPKPGESTQAERSIILVGRSGEAAKVRGMFVHPNQLRFAARQVAGVKAVQGAVSQPDNRDNFVVRAEIEAGADTTAVSQQLKEAIQGVCRVRVDAVEPVPAGTITDETPGMVDERLWN
jgi:phenylacetate-CoA ligase